MATPSNTLALGMKLPSFSLPDTVSGKIVESSLLTGKVGVVVFICNHCPYVKRIREGLAAFGRTCQERGVAMVAVSSNDVTTHPDDGPELMAREAREAGYPFPYLYDESQSVAKAFDAACTPDLYIFDAQGKLAYHGQFDAARPRNDEPVTGKDARAAIEALLAGKTPSPEQTASIGCNIKWKAS
ncbi:MAG TPA: thioredoxin family protein [Polyangiaceae bacterium]|jgi:peroxiredoxin